jgi:uncharacterized protein
VRIIDCLEFNDRLRMVDTFDEIVFLDLELRTPSESPGSADASSARWRTGRPPECRRTSTCCFIAAVGPFRARLAIAHLLEPDTQTPEKWPILDLCPTAT